MILIAFTILYFLIKCFLKNDNETLILNREEALDKNVCAMVYNLKHELNTDSVQLNMNYPWLWYGVSME